MVAVAVSMILYGVPPELCVRYVIVCTLVVHIDVLIVVVDGCWVMVEVPRVVVAMICVFEGVVSLSVTVLLKTVAIVIGFDDVDKFWIAVVLSFVDITSIVSKYPALKTLLLYRTSPRGFKDAIDYCYLDKSWIKLHTKGIYNF